MESRRTCMGKVRSEQRINSNKRTENSLNAYLNGERTLKTLCGKQDMTRNGLHANVGILKCLLIQVLKNFLTLRGIFARQ